MMWGFLAILIQLTGQPIVGATKYEREVLRCSACQSDIRWRCRKESEGREVHGVGGCKRDSAGEIRVECCLHRLARMEKWYVRGAVGESVQFERCEAVADRALPVYLEMRRLGAQGR
ncbi:MAG: hypothetical protein KIT57_11890 [Blastocatellales bacterium]|nr:hypothetical protein [Blastocatellales bacterium]